MINKILALIHKLIKTNNYRWFVRVQNELSSVSCPILMTFDRFLNKIFCIRMGLKKTSKKSKMNCHILIIWQSKREKTFNNYPGFSTGFSSIDCASLLSSLSSVPEWEKKRRKFELRTLKYIKIKLIRPIQWEFNNQTHQQADLGEGFSVSPFPQSVWICIPDKSKKESKFSISIKCLQLLNGTDMKQSEQYTYWNIKL